MSDDTFVWLPPPTGLEIYVEGVLVAKRAKINLVGFSVIDDPVNDTTRIAPPEE